MAEVEKTAMEEMKEQMAIDLDGRICNHIAHGSISALETIQTYHMQEINEIRDYMMDFLDDWYFDPRQLNQFFHMAVAELKIDLGALLVIPMQTKAVENVEKKMSLVI